MRQDIFVIYMHTIPQRELQRNMSDSKYMFLSLVVLIVVGVVYTEAAERPLGRAKTLTPSKYIITLSQDTSDERFRELESSIQGVVASGQKIRSLNGKFVKFIVAELSDEALVTVSSKFLQSFS